MVPWLRPAELATDTSTSVDVAVHALDWYESAIKPVDGLLLLQPTSPFRTKATITAGIALFRDHEKQAVIGVSLTPAHPMWTFRLQGGHMSPFIPGNGINTRSQDLPPAYVVNGCFYLVTPSALRTERTFVPKVALPLVIESPEEALDIDTEWDWKMAELMSKG